MKAFYDLKVKKKVRSYDLVHKKITAKFTIREKNRLSIYPVSEWVAVGYSKHLSPPFMATSYLTTAAIFLYSCCLTPKTKKIKRTQAIKIHSE